jgi:hypothetical protein
MLTVIYGAVATKWNGLVCDEERIMVLYAAHRELLQQHASTFNDRKGLGSYRKNFGNPSNPNRNSGNPTNPNGNLQIPGNNLNNPQIPSRNNPQIPGNNLNKNAPKDGIFLPKGTCHAELRGGKCPKNKQGCVATWHIGDAGYPVAEVKAAYEKGGKKPPAGL